MRRVQSLSATASLVAVVLLAAPLQVRAQRPGFVTFDVTLEVLNLDGIPFVVGLPDKDEDDDPKEKVTAEQLALSGIAFLGRNDVDAELNARAVKADPQTIDGQTVSVYRIRLEAPDRSQVARLCGLNCPIASQSMFAALRQCRRLLGFPCRKGDPLRLRIAERRQLASLAIDGSLLADRAGDCLVTESDCTKNLTAG